MFKLSNRIGDMASFKRLAIMVCAVAVFLSATSTTWAIAEEKSVISVSIADAIDLGMKRIEVQSRVDELKVFDVIVNRGNCKADTAESAINSALPGMGDYVRQLAHLSGATLKKKGETLKFGEKILFMINVSCDVLEVNVKTSEGDIKVDAE